MKNDILQYLKDDIRFRERANKNKGIANLIAKKYGIEIPKDKQDDFIADILGADRYWRMCLSEDETLRGSDYDTKEIVEQRAEIKLGYQPMHAENVKALNNL